MTGEKLPQWQADRLVTLLAELDGVPISDAERRSLAWLCGFEDHTVVHLAAVIHRIKVRSEARWLIEADRHRSQLVDLCLCAGIDPGEDPHAALMAHLRGRGPGGVRS